MWNSYGKFKIDLNFRLLIEENISRKIAFSVKRFHISKIHKQNAKNDVIKRQWYNFFSSLTQSYWQKTAVKITSRKNNIIIFVITWRKGKWCIYCYFMTIRSQLLGKTKAHASRGKIKISKCSLIRKMNFRDIRVYNVYYYVVYDHFVGLALKGLLLLSYSIVRWICESLLWKSEAAARVVLCKKASKFIKKETLSQVFSCEFCEISKNTFFTEHLWWLLLENTFK